MVKLWNFYFIWLIKNAKCQIKWTINNGNVQIVMYSTMNEFLVIFFNLFLDITSLTNCIHRINYWLNNQWQIKTTVDNVQTIKCPQIFTNF